jgi:thiol-disulfide isomerase/thioredoxin
MNNQQFVSFNNPSRLPGGGESGLFSRIKSSFSNMSSTTLVIIGIILLFSVISIVYYIYYVSPTMKPKYSHNNEESMGGNGSSSHEAELLFFYTDWCPHCKTAKPIWGEVKSEFENKTVNGYHITFTEIDCSNETAEVEQMMNKYNVEGYPTIKLLKDGQVIEYDAKPSKDTLTQFLNTVL